MHRYAWLIGIGIFIGAATAHSSPSTCAEADRQVDAGLTLMREGNAAGALALFEQAFARCPSPRAQAQIGLAEAALTQWAEAHEHLSAALANQTDAWIATRQEPLKAALAQIDAHVGWVEMKGGNDGAELLLDGKPWGRLPFASSRAALPGTHRAEMKVPELDSPIRREVNVRLGVTETIAWPVVQPPRFRWRRTGTIGLAVGGLLLAGGAVAHGFYVPQVTHYNNCVAVGKTRDEVCPGERGTVLTEMGLAIAGYALGGALSVTSIVLLALPGEQSRTAVTCGAGPGDVGVACVGSF